MCQLRACSCRPAATVILRRKPRSSHVSHVLPPTPECGSVAIPLSVAGSREHSCRVTCEESLLRAFPIRLSFTLKKYYQMTVYKE